MRLFDRRTLDAPERDNGSVPAPRPRLAPRLAALAGVAAAAAGYGAYLVMR